MEAKIDILMAEAREIQSFLEEAYTNDVEIMSARLTQINVYLARTAEMLSLAKQLQDIATNAAFATHTNAIMKMTPSISKIFIGSVTEKENMAVNWIEKQCSSLVHQGDNLRTQISLEKQLLDLTRKGY